MGSLEHRLTPPPDEAYALHRTWASNLLNASAAANLKLPVDLFIYKYMEVWTAASGPWITHGQEYKHERLRVNTDG